MELGDLVVFKNGNGVDVGRILRRHKGYYGRVVVRGSCSLHIRKKSDMLCLKDLVKKYKKEVL